MREIKKAKNICVHKEITDKDFKVTIYQDKNRINLDDITQGETKGK